MKKRTTHILLALSAMLWMPLAASADVYEPFDYPADFLVPWGSSQKPGRLTLPELAGGTGWDSYSRTPSWQVSNSAELPPARIISDASLPHPVDPEYSSVGRALENLTESRFLIFNRVLDVYGSFGDLLVEPIAAEQAAPIIGIGKAGGQVWFSFLVRPSDEDRTMFYLHDSSKSEAASGVTIIWNPLNKVVRAGTGSAGLPEGSAASANVKSEDFFGTVVFVVGRVDFGPDWGTRTRAEGDDGLGEANGRMLVWMNPSMDITPQDGNAGIDVPVHEFLFDTIRLQLGRGAAFDEIRLGTSFDAVSGR